MDTADADASNSNEESSPTSQRQESSPPTQSPIGTPLTGRPRLEPSKPPSAVALSATISPLPANALSEPFRPPSKSPELLSQKLQQPAGDDASLMQPMNASISTIDMPEQLKEILAPTPPSQSPPFHAPGAKIPQYNEHRLRIENLPVRLTDDGFLDLFVQFGDIQSARLVTNPDGTTRGYGYVTFQTHENALQAIKHYDGFILWGQALKATFARTSPNQEPSIIEGSLLTISQFPRSWSIVELRTCFQEFGEILDVSIVESRCIGLVRFLRSLDARVAMSARNGWIPPGHGHALNVRLGSESSTPEPGTVFPAACSPNSETYEMPINLFGGLYSPPRRYESSIQEERRAVPNQYQHKMKERERSKPAPVTSATTPCSEMVFLYNLPTFFQRPHVENFCGLYGKIQSVSMQQDNTGCYLGMAYVMYSSREEAKEAVKALNGCSMFKQTIVATLTKSS